jgi:16S rRNA (cytosine967-C5)-methyltransferase
MMPSASKPSRFPGSIHRAQLFQAAELLAPILAGEGPADRLMEHYFRAHRNMGKRDRGFVADAVYGVQHRRRKIEWALAGTEGPVETLGGQGRPPHPPVFGGAGALVEPTGLAHVLAWLTGFGGWSAADLQELGFGEAGAALAARWESFDEGAVAFAVRADLPDELAARLVGEFGEAEAASLARGLHEPASLDLRVNGLRATREQAAARLAEDGFAAEPTPFSPDGLRCRGRKPLQATGAFREGWIEVQDEGSQLIGVLADPKPGERVADFCAGAGGKTLHLATRMQNRGGVFAFDVSAKRLKALRERLRRAHLDNIRLSEIADESDPHLERYRGSMARVLVDAPCSNTGTARRNPDALWRPLDLEALTALQSRILAAASRLVAPGGRLVYATCSLLREETEDVVGTFLASNSEFRIVHAGSILESKGIDISGAVTAEGYLRLLPHLHRTDGFRAAVLERAS